MTDHNQHTKDQQLQAYLDGILEPVAAERVQSHLDACPTCRDELARLEGMAARLQSLPEVPLSRDLSGLVVSQLKREQALSPAITWTLVIEALAAGAVIAFLIPALQAAVWLPRLLGTGLEIQAAVNIFLTQIASNWLVWWIALKLQLSQMLGTFNPLEGLHLGAVSPWILIGAAGGLVVLTNALLLGRQPLLDRNHKGSQI
jgi:predicted anti-sigma-YlaC factor YlaD